MKVLYIAGPYNGTNAWIRENHIRGAENATLRLIKNGFAPICVHTMCRFFSGADDERVFVDVGLELLTHCDGVIVLEDWVRSPGTQKEIMYALEHNIPVFYSLADARKYFK